MLDVVWLFKAIAPNITFSHCYHHSQTIEVTEEDAKTLKWYDMAKKQQFVCDECAQPFSAQGGQFVSCPRDSWMMYLKARKMNGYVVEEAVSE